jgi:hypothetical protein
MVENLIIVTIGGIAALAVLLIMEVIANWKGWK